MWRFTRSNGTPDGFATSEMASLRLSNFEKSANVSRGYVLKKIWDGAPSFGLEIVTGFRL